MFDIVRRLAASFAGAVVVAACFHSTSTRTTLDPDQKFARGMQLFREGHFGEAQKVFQGLQFELVSRDTLLPRTRYYFAETFAGLDDYIAAAREFRRVADDFPSDALAPYAMLRAGDQYGRMWRRPELDPSNAETAIATYQELIGRFPDSPAAQIAQVRILTLQEWYARKDFENGMFYFKRGGFDSAILYFRSLIAQYPGAAVVPDAYLKLAQAYHAIGYREEREETCAHLREHYGTRADVREVCGNGSTGR